MRLALFAALITLVGCSGSPDGGGGGGGSGGGGSSSSGGGSSSSGGGTSSSGGGSSSNGGGSSSSGGGSSSNGGGSSSNGGGGSSSSGGGSSSSGGGSSSSGGGTSSSGGGTSSSGGGTSSSGGGTSSAGGGTSSSGGGSSSGSAIKKVFVIALENQGTSSVYSSSNAPFLNGALMADGGYATMYGDVLSSSTPSEPHYVWMEAGTNAFMDHTFTSDSDPSGSNSTSSTNHLVTQLKNAANPKTWRAYQEDLDATNTGACPVTSGDSVTNFYAAKHDPFVFFQDVSGATPSKTNTDCAAHHKAYTLQTLQADLNANDVADYTFITPNLCDDMHGAVLCSNQCNGLTGCVSAGDTWLKNNIGPILAYINANDGVLFLLWDEPATSGNEPFVVIGPHVKKGHVSSISYNHSSYLKSLEEIFGVPVMSNVQNANDFSDFFETGYFP